MSLGTKNRQKQTAETCKQHLREKYRDQLGLVEEFISEFEGVGQRLRPDPLEQFYRHSRYRKRDALSPGRLFRDLA